MPEESLKPEDLISLSPSLGESERIKNAAIIGAGVQILHPFFILD